MSLDPGRDFVIVHHKWWLRSYVNVPSADNNAWYYPSHGHDSDEDDDLPTPSQGNWGKKKGKQARWMRRGKMSAWGPGMEDWEAEERARKRMKSMLPSDRRSRSLSPPALPHLRSPSPPHEPPYPSPVSQHLSYASFVMDKGMTYSFRSSMLDDLWHATNNLIEGEGSMRRALGRLWQAMSEDPENTPSTSRSEALVPKREEEEDEAGDERDVNVRGRRLVNVPDLTPPTQKIFLLSHSNSNGRPPVINPSDFAHPDMQLESLEKSLATVREFLDDGREYVERLEEVREELGIVRTQRNVAWDMIRDKAVKELQDVAHSTTM
ncbi:hypothetical protein JAAARDRAFT_37863 [Jaapia argillacea MUCL 33604]|uniref:Transcriptional regulatory protein RXT2 N-terminal domain-containing protein n=1 Tax=Jaapia argillacea MUCL 33604 TaxID=933084 RepID=A0A067PIW9_9AGAM|nr:hypothetical protein JAAARDRAFT_37863 [Jaapia argillacea MUCL 33604]